MADWLMLNLNHGAITGDGEAYDHAERILWNALAFSQWITGSFGMRSTMPGGYNTSNLSLLETPIIFSVG